MRARPPGGGTRSHGASLRGDRGPDRRRQDQSRAPPGAQLRQRTRARAGRREPVSRALLSQSARSRVPDAAAFSCSSAHASCRTCARRTCSRPLRVADYLLDKDRLFARLTLDERGVHALRTGLRAPRDRRAACRTSSCTCRRRSTCCSSASRAAASDTSSTSSGATSSAWPRRTRGSSISTTPPRS